MKNIKYIGAVLLSLVLTFSIQSCSKDEGPGEEPIIPPVEEPSNPSVQAKKRIAEITTAIGDKRTTIKFKYNEDNKLQSVEADNFHLNYNYGENKIVVNEKAYSVEYLYDHRVNKKIILHDGETKEYIFSYDNQNHLTSFQDILYKWEGDNIVEVTDTISGMVTNYTYYPNEKNIFMHDFDPLIYMMPGREDHSTFMIFPELLGTGCKNLIRQRTEKAPENTSVATYNYDHDTDGYITHIHETLELSPNGEKKTSERDFYLTWIQ